MTDEFDSDIQNQDDPYLLKIDLQNCRDQWHEHALKQGLEIARLRAEAEENKAVLDLCGNTERHLRDKAAGLFMEGEKKDGQIAALTAQLGQIQRLVLNRAGMTHGDLDTLEDMMRELGGTDGGWIYRNKRIGDTNND